MQGALRHSHQPSSLSVVFVITLAVLLMACVYVVMGVTELVGLEGEGIAGAFPFIERLF